VSKHDSILPRQATGDTLAQAGAGASDDDRQAPIRVALSNAMVGMKKEYYGRGPERAKTYINDEYVFVVMEGGLTRNEETLLAAGRDDLVRRYRLEFQEAMTETSTKAVEELTGRSVVGYHSQMLFDPPRSIEIFVLDPPL
jgi:uncharacterized protein YbcI